MASSILTVRGLTKRFEGLVALSDLSFDLKRGEILGLIGPNGAGKTTLVSLISGTLRPSLGELKFEGYDLKHLPAYRRARLGIARTFQITRPFPGLTVLDNVAVGALFGTGAGNHELARARALAREKLDFVSLAHRAGQRADDVLLTEEVGRRLRPIAPIQRQVLRVLSHCDPLNDGVGPCTRHRHRKTRSLLRTAGSSQANLRHPPETA